jgi:hypothetical protein
MKTPKAVRAKNNSTIYQFMRFIYANIADRTKQKNELTMKAALNEYLFRLNNSMKNMASTKAIMKAPAVLLFTNWTRPYIFPAFVILVRSHILSIAIEYSTPYCKYDRYYYNP